MPFFILMVSIRTKTTSLKYSLKDLHMGLSDIPCQQIMLSGVYLRVNNINLRDSCPSFPKLRSEK